MTKIQVVADKTSVLAFLFTNYIVVGIYFLREFLSELDNNTINFWLIL